MKSLLLLLTFLLTFSLALPTPDDDAQDGDKGKSKHENRDEPKKGNCVKALEARKFIERYIGFFSRNGSDLGDAEATGDALIADDIKQYSFSMSSVRGHSVTQGYEADAGLLQNGKEKFMENVLHNPRLPVKGIRSFSALAACDDGESRIIWHWQFDSVGDKGEYPVRGYTIFSVDRDDGPGEFKAHRIDMEFDSVAWVLDEGGKVESGRSEGSVPGYGHK
ncbi:hypothetical protein AC579_2084 [Pseudocercospora musae]|uniref:NTF2-like domain-containing protein n=1 Tax=Pseudocercospora musae TaxID=113226 RepID=A0A139I516_9PEZI|nr:hypothetical protein AC579_2084 [Pseudocercospora musae]